MIKILSVSKEYPGNILALSNIDLEIPQGEFIFINGSQGSGKTTLLKLIMGLEEPTSGEIFVDRVRINRSKGKKVYQIRRRIGFISSEFKLLKNRSIKDNLIFTLEVIGFPHSKIKQRVSETLKRISLEKRENDLIQSLSAGEQQLVSIARAIVKEPNIILADEPTNLLNEDMIGRVMGIFSELHYYGTTVVFATQNNELVQKYKYPIVSLSEGKIVKEEIYNLRENGS